MLCGLVTISHNQQYISHNKLPMNKATGEDKIVGFWLKTCNRY